MRVGLPSIRRSVLARDTGWALVGDGLAVVVMVLSFTLLGRRLGPEGYGEFVGLYALLGPAIAINHSAIGFAIYDHVVGRGEPGHEVGGAGLTSTLAIGAGLSVVVLTLASTLLPQMSIALVALFTVGELLVNAVLVLGIAVVQAVRSYRAAARLRIMVTVCRGAMIMALASFDALTLRNLGIAQIIVAGSLLLIVFGLIRRDTGRILVPTAIRYELLKTIGTYASGMAAFTVQLGGDKVVLNSAGHVADAGLYGAAYRVVMLAQIPISALASSTHMNFLARDAGDAVALSRRYSLVAGAYAAVAALGFIVAAPILPVLLGPEFEEATSIVRWLSPVVIMAAITPFASNGLLTLGRNRLRTGILVGNAAFAVLLYVVLIPPFSWRGALAASLIADLSMAMVMWAVLLRLRPDSARAVVDGE